MSQCIVCNQLCSNIQIVFDRYIARSLTKIRNLSEIDISSKIILRRMWNVIPHELKTKAGSFASGRQNATPPDPDIRA